MKSAKAALAAIASSRQTGLSSRQMLLSTAQSAELGGMGWVEVGAAEDGPGDGCCDGRFSSCDGVRTAEAANNLQGWRKGATATRVNGSEGVVCDTRDAVLRTGEQQGMGRMTSKV